MRIYKTDQTVEFPEKTPEGYKNIRSSVRVDVRPGECLLVATGIALDFNPKQEQVRVFPVIGMDYILDKSGNLSIILCNTDIRNYYVYPGAVIAYLEYKKLKSTHLEDTKLNFEEELETSAQAILGEESTGNMVPDSEIDLTVVE